MRIANVRVVLVAAILIFSLLIPAVSLQSADAATTTISSDTTWGNKTINAGDIVILQSGVTLTINGVVTVHGRLDINGIVRLQSTGRFSAEPGAVVNINDFGSVRGTSFADDLFVGKANSVINLVGSHSEIDFLNMECICSEGVLNVVSGTQDLGGKWFRFGDGSTINSGAVVNGRALEFVGSVTINPLAIVNVQQGTAPAFLNANLLMRGFVDLDGFITVADTAKIRIAAGSLVVRNGGEIHNDGQIHSFATLTILSGGYYEGLPGGRLYVRQGVVNNFGIVDILQGSLLNVWFAGASAPVFNLENNGVLNVIGEASVDDSTLNIKSGGIMNVKKGDNPGAAGVFILFPVGTINNSGDINVSPQGTMTLSGPLNINNGGVLDVFAFGKVNIQTSFGVLNIANGGTVNVNSAGSITTTTKGKVENSGTFNVAGKLISNTDSFVNVNNLGKLNVNSGTVNIFGVMTVKSGGTAANSGAINQQCGGIVTVQSGATYTGTPVVVHLCYPVTHMSDTSASIGVKIAKGGNTIIGERATAGSALLGDKIDQITLRLKKTGAPSGNAIVGVFNNAGALKKQFGTIDTATLTTTFKDYSVTLTGGALYTVVAGDRIGIKYAQGDTGTNFVLVMTDTNAANPFDGTNSHLQRFNAGVWSGVNTHDMYMILKQTHP